VPAPGTEPLQRWSMALRAAGRASTTIAAYLERVSRLAKWADRNGLGRWTLTGEHLISFSGSQSWARETRRGIRNAICGFYRWAHGLGLVSVDPSVALPRVSASTNSRRPASETAVHTA